MEKPICKMVGENGNVYNLLSLAGKALRKADQAHKVDEMQERVFNCGSYDQALMIMGEYVEIE